MKYVIEHKMEVFPFYVKDVDNKQHAISVEVEPKLAKQFNGKEEAEQYIKDMKLPSTCKVIPIRQELTWEKLKEVVNSLTDDQLANPVLWWGVDRGGIVCSIDKLEEDYVNHGEGYGPSSEYNQDEYPIEDADGTLPKGTPIMWVD